MVGDATVKHVLTIINGVIEKGVNGTCVLSPIVISEGISEESKIIADGIYNKILNNLPVVEGIEIFLRREDPIAMGRLPAYLVMSLVSAFMMATNYTLSIRISNIKKGEIE